MSRGERPARPPTSVLKYWARGVSGDGDETWGRERRGPAKGPQTNAELRDASPGAGHGGSITPAFEAPAVGVRILGIPKL